MTDIVSPERRSQMMRKVRGRDTSPEMIVRHLVHREGYRFRLHRKDLPGSPDLVFPARRKIVFVHGCFWHRHEGCRRTTSPGTRVEFWQEKFRANRERDARVTAALAAMGWSILVVWECETSDPDALGIALRAFLGPPRAALLEAPLL